MTNCAPLTLILATQNLHELERKWREFLDVHKFQDMLSSTANVKKMAANQVCLFLVQVKFYYKKYMKIKFKNLDPEVQKF